MDFLCRAPFILAGPPDANKKRELLWSSPPYNAVTSAQADSGDETAAIRIAERVANARDFWYIQR